MKMRSYTTIISGAVTIDSFEAIPSTQAITERVSQLFSSWSYVVSGFSRTARMLA